MMRMIRTINKDVKEKKGGEPCSLPLFKKLAKAYSPQPGRSASQVFDFALNAIVLFGVG
ncbi:hypothetical protein SAMN05660463_00068 [Pseudomonas sp. URIL14HWK12:I9]|nr:hypothetical protein F474_01336 [Pseudomonas sp. URIL14HWK12:I12]PVZ27798.1 hypothetical protein F470_00991 [Pseudomonas sp. URIL14HWK12:I10]PVZ38687.1 hypothetical protein F472_01336 [Pseudomonas sp. URIL14HWK12:I11]SNZ02364.1 hypothetical protein SAMN05660463_00068 [Pseudomonas sp. URIL14HWK12:I9]